MFRLVKQNYAGNNAPRYEKFSSVGCGFIPKAGAAVDRNGNTLIMATYFPRYIVAKDYTLNSSDTYLCYEVTDDMVFKVNFIGEGTPALGKMVGVATSGTLIDAVKLNEEGCGRIVGLDENPDYVYVKFDRKREYEEW